MSIPLRLPRAVSTTQALDFTYDSSGLRTSKTIDGVTHKYLYAGGKLMRETYGSNTLDFFYDANGTPYALKYNGTVYYYITNLQGDVIQIVDASGNAVATYEYDPYGKVISATGTLAETNPIRYRGYYYDTETGLYYLQSRYYDPTVGRFVNSDSYACTGQGLIGHNTFAYCGNNPISRIDTLGDSWVAVLGAVGVQYASDVLGNIADGKIGCDIFIPTSSLATYTAVAITSLIPGGNLVSAAVRSTVSEAITWTDNILRGEAEKNNAKQSLINIATNTVIDVGMGQLMDRTFGQMGSKDFTSYAQNKVANNTMTNLQKTYATMQRSNTIGRTIGKMATRFFETVVNFFTR